MFDDNNKVTQLSLFDKFDNVVVNPVAIDNELAIAKDDQLFCEEIQKEFNLAIENAREFQALFDGFQITRRPTDLLHLKTCLYVPNEDFKGKIEELKKTFIRQIFYYFANKYYLKEIDLTHLAENDNLDTKMVFERILSEFGDLINYSESRLKKDYKTQFCAIWTSEPDLVPTLKNNRVIVPHAFYYELWSRGSSITHTQEEYLDLFIRAISFFETGSNQPLELTLPDTGIGSTVDFSKPYHLNLKKINGVKFFKNGRVDLIFDSAESAREFFHMFDMANPIDNRR
ncbi:MAG: hypothetical protein KAW12_10145 [Candidatus Aminicenantes bacterium]|nr:hypothetical protein [Candidatus Aminicenantes bacterium]